MRQIQWPGQSEAKKLAMYKLIFAKDASNTVQPNAKQNQTHTKSKRFRSAFTTEQINYLETQYKKFPYINSELRKEIADFLKLEERSVKVWFQNRRMKEKKESSKEHEYSITVSPQVFTNDQFNSLSAVPSTNDQRVYSLPILSHKSILSMNDGPSKSYPDSNKKVINTGKKAKPTTIQGNNTNMEDKKKVITPAAKYYNETQEKEFLSPYFQVQSANNTTWPIRNPKNKTSQPERYHSAEHSISLCKKYKPNSNKTATAVSGNTLNEGSKKKKAGFSEAKQDTNMEKTPEDYSTKQPRLSCPPTDPMKQVTVNNPAYYPVMPTIYTPPFISSGGVLWNPVNVMPVMATNTPPVTIPGTQGSTAHEIGQNCMCNCHTVTQHVPANFPPSFQNPYTPYVFTVPYQHTSPKY